MNKDYGFLMEVVELLTPGLESNIWPWRTSALRVFQHGHVRTAPAAKSHGPRGLVRD